MIYLYIHQRVEDYPRWRESFDNHLAARQAGGATREALVLRNADDPYEIIVLLGWRELAQARTFIQSARFADSSGVCQIWRHLGGVAFRSTRMEVQSKRGTTPGITCTQDNLN